MLEFSLCIPTLNRYDLLLAEIDSALNNPFPPMDIHIVDNGSKFVLPESLREVVTVYNFDRNIGVAASWNYFFMNIISPKIISNDDILFYPDTFEKLMTDYEKLDEKMIFYPKGQAGSMFSLFLIRDVLYERVGQFDEIFYPAYFEDNDYYRRIELTFGTDIFHQSDCDYIHKKSSTIAKFSNKQLEEHHSNFRKNQLYYRKKWGGQPGFEIFTTPFGR